MIVLVIKMQLFSYKSKMIYMYLNTVKIKIYTFMY